MFRHVFEVTDPNELAEKIGVVRRRSLPILREPTGRERLDDGRVSHLRSSESPVFQVGTFILMLSLNIDGEIFLHRNRIEIH